MRLFVAPLLAHLGYAIWIRRKAMKRMLALLSVATLSLAARAGAQGTAPTGQQPVEMKASGTPGKANASRALRMTATVYAIDVDRRILTLQHDMGGTETMKVGPEVTRLGDVKAGDTIVVDYQQGLALEFQPAGSEWVPPTSVETGARPADGQATVAARASGTKGTVTVTAIDLPRRLVTIQGPGGNVYRVKAGPSVQIEKLKVGDQLLATYVEAVAVKLGKPEKK
jgi:Cu/Ag efflux protein CusF